MDFFEEEHEDEEERPDYQWSGRDGLIFLIDATLPMFVKPDDESEMIPFKLCIKCAHSTLTNKIVSSERDVVGVVLFGTENQCDSSFPHIYVLQSVEQPGAERILHLEKIVNSNTCDEFADKIGHSFDFSLQDALWQCYSMFQNCGIKLNNRRVLLFTTTDNPHQDSLEKQRLARRKALDLKETGIEIDLMHIGQGFSVAKFYQDIIFLDSDEEYGKDFPSPAEKFEELLTRVRHRDHKKRSVGKIKFNLGGGLSMAVGVYNLVRKMSKPFKVRLDKTTNEEVQSITKEYLRSNGAILLPGDFQKYRTYGGKKIQLDVDEARSIRCIEEPGLELLGFKPVSKIKLHHYVSPASFIYPEETVVKGSRALFSALLQRCLHRQVAPVCRLVSRRNDSPHLVALLPQSQSLDAAGTQVMPPGFHVVFLPFADDMRALKLKRVAEPDSKHIEVAKQIVRKLRFSYSPEQFENPDLQTHWSNIEALALDRDTVEETQDYTMPDYERMAEKAGQVIEEFKELVFPQPDPESQPATNKRPPPSNNEKRKYQRKK